MSGAQFAENAWAMACSLACRLLHHVLLIPRYTVILCSYEQGHTELAVIKAMTGRIFDGVHAISSARAHMGVRLSVSLTMGRRRIRGCSITSIAPSWSHAKTLLLC